MGARRRTVRTFLPLQGLAAAAALLGAGPDAAQTDRRGPFVTEIVSLTEAGGALYGSLLAPASGRAVPVVLILPGSGNLIGGRGVTIRSFLIARSPCSLWMLEQDPRQFRARPVSALEQTPPTPPLDLAGCKWISEDGTRRKTTKNPAFWRGFWHLPGR